MSSELLQRNVLASQEWGAVLVLEGVSSFLSVSETLINGRLVDVTMLQVPHLVPLLCSKLVLGFLTHAAIVVNNSTMGQIFVSCLVEVGCSWLWFVVARYTLSYSNFVEPQSHLLFFFLKFHELLSDLWQSSFGFLNTWVMVASQGHPILYPRRLWWLWVSMWPQRQFLPCSIWRLWHRVLVLQTGSRSLHHNFILWLRTGVGFVASQRRPKTLFGIALPRWFVLLPSYRLLLLGWSLEYAQN